MTRRALRLTAAGVPSEHEEQVAFIEWCQRHEGRYPALRCLFAIPNGGARNIVVARKLKAEGVKTGVPDLFLPMPRSPHGGGRIYAGLFVEMKRRKGGTLSKSQRWWKARLEACGYRVEVCRGWEEAARVVTEYLGK